MSITAVTFCPQPLFLLPEYAGQQPVAPELRAACVTAVRRLATVSDRIVLISGGPDPVGYTDPARDLARSTAGGRVGLALLADADADAEVGGPVTEVAVRFDLATDLCLAVGNRQAEPRPGAPAGERVGLLVMADGSARRGEKAPGYVDDRSSAFDEVFVTALRSGDADALAGLDADLAAALLFQGRAALQVAAGAVAGVSSSRIVPLIDWVGDPFGVMYAVAHWSVT